MSKMASTAFCCILRGGVFLSSSLRTSHGFSFSMPVRHGHWFTKYYNKKRLTRPISNEVLEKYKERSGANLPESTSAPALLRKYLDDSVPESVKKIHSFEFVGIESAIDDVMKEKLMELGLDPVQDSTAHEIVRLTVRIRVQREQMDKRKNTRALERTLLEMLARRSDLVRLLRSEDYSQFLSLSEALELSYEHQARPGEVEPPRPGFPSRLAETRDRCQRMKLKRLADLAARMEAAKGEFKERREATLKEASEKLGSLGLTLDQVLDEVYADRRARSERELIEDQLHWYYGEQRAHLAYVAKLAEKAKAAQTRGRK